MPHHMDELDLEALVNHFGGGKKKKINSEKGGLKQGEALLAKDLTLPSVMPETTPNYSPSLIDTPEATVEAEKEPLRQIEDILLALEKFSPEEVREKSGKKWFDAKLNRRHEAIVRIKKAEGKMSGLMGEGVDFSVKDGQELLDGIYYMSQPELRERHREDWLELKDFLENKAGLDTAEKILSFEKLYVEGKEAETALTRMTGPGEIDRMIEIKDELLLIKEYMSTGRFPKGWGSAKRALEEKGVAVTSYERMREMEKKKKDLDIKIFGRREVPSKPVSAVENISGSWEKKYKDDQMFLALKQEVDSETWQKKVFEWSQMNEKSRDDSLLIYRALMKIKGSGEVTPESQRLWNSQKSKLEELGLML